MTLLLILIAVGSVAGLAGVLRFIGCLAGTAVISFAALVALLVIL